MTTSTQTVENYIATWNERDPEARKRLAEETFSSEAEYLDPLMSSRGVDGIDAMIEAAQQQFPGHTFTLSAGPDEHNDRVRFSWQLAAEDGQAVVGGTDVAVVAPDGRFTSVTGFIDPV